MSANQTKINWAGVAVYGVLAAVIILLVLYFLPNSPIKPSIDGAISKINLPQFKLPDLNGAVQWLTQNAALVGVVSTLGTTVITLLVKNWQNNKLLDKTEAKLTDTELELLKTQKEAAKVSDLQKQIDTLNSDTAAEELQTKLSKLSDEKMFIEAQLKSVQAQNQELMDKLANTPVKVIKVAV